jgi:hypothetical protein
MPIAVFVVVLIAAAVVAFLGARLLRRPWSSCLVATAVGPLFLAAALAGSASSSGLGPFAGAIYIGVTLLSALAGGVGVFLAVITWRGKRNE